MSAHCLKEYFISVPYFHTKFSNINEVMCTLIPHLNENGYFLIRKSFSKANTLTVSVTDNLTVKHFNIIISSQNCFCIHELTFFTIEDLINFYKNQDVPNAEGYPNIRLLYPILTPNCQPKVSVSHEMANHDPFPRPTGEMSTHSGSLWNIRSFMTRRKCSNLKISSLENLRMKHQSSNLKVASCKNFCSIVEDQARQKVMFRKDDDRMSERAMDQQGLTLRTPFNNQIMTKQNLEKGKEEIPHYSCVRNENENLLEYLIEQLTISEVAQEDEKCNCGLLLADCQLPGGWSVHLSTEPGSLGRVFFTSPEDSTMWQLPPEISHQLTKKQLCFVKSLNHQKKNRQ